MKGATAGSRESSAERRVAVLCGAAAIALGIAGLVGWGLGIPFLTRVVAGYKAIAPSVCLLLIILGLALVRMAAERRGRHERLAWMAMVALISLYGLLEVVGALVSADLNGEDALTRRLARLSSIPFETMSPVAGVLLFLVGAAVLALLVRPRRRGLGDAAGALGMGAVVVAVIFALGYVYGAPLLYGSPAIPISAMGCLGGLALAVGVVAAAGRSHWPLRALAGGSVRARLLRAFVPLTVFAVLAVAVAHHRMHALETVSHVLVGSTLAVIFALAAGLVAARVARGIGEGIDQAALAQQQAEEALRESQADLNRAQAVARTGSWRLNVQRNELLWSDETHRIFGIPTGTPLTYEAFLATVHPEDRQDVDRKWTAALGGERYDIEHRILVGDTLKWVRETAELEFDEEGTLLGGFGTVQDVTERKQAELERERQARLLEAIAENTDAHLVYLDRDFNFIWVNSAYARACRRAKEEFVGHNHFEFYPHAENEAIFQRVRDTGQPARYIEKPFEFPDMPERGVTYWDWTLTPLKNAQGEVENLIFSLADATEKVRVREQLLEAERLRAQMAEMVALEINHRMKNNLMLVSGLLELQLTAQPAASDAAAALQQAKARISALSTVHEQMYERRSGQVELGDVLRRVAEVAAATLAADVALTVSSDPVEVPARAASTLAIVCNELITNALKHGAPGPDGKRQVDVALSHQPRRPDPEAAETGGRGRVLRLRVWSSGNPVPAAFERQEHKGIGLQLCRELVGAQLRGSLRVWADQGGTASEIVVDDHALEREGGAA